MDLRVQGRFRRIEQLEGLHGKRTNSASLASVFQMELFGDVGDTSDVKMGLVHGQLLCRLRKVSDPHTYF